VGITQFCAVHVLLRRLHHQSCAVVDESHALLSLKYAMQNLLAERSQWPVFFVWRGEHLPLTP
jgi:hypothetical protein